MEYRITHITTYKYTSPVSVCHNAVFLSPTSTADQTVLEHDLLIDPKPIVQQARQDMFGNIVHRFSLEELHSQLTIRAVSRVRLNPKVAPVAESSPSCRAVAESLHKRTDSNWLQVVPFQFDSPRIQRGTQYADYARTAIADDQPVIAGLAAITKQIHSDFKYDKDATLVDTPVSVAFQQRSGVCQDFAHIAVTCLRSVGIAARYVSGYLRTNPPPGKPRLVGADQSHAWIAAYCGAEFGWVEFDPTNDCFCGTDHIRVASGRDYSDVVPIKGVFLGGGEPELSVSVDVAPI